VPAQHAVFVTVGASCRAPPSDLFRAGRICHALLNGFNPGLGFPATGSLESRERAAHADPRQTPRATSPSKRRGKRGRHIPIEKPVKL
jgi:hypothetical protein